MSISFECVSPKKHHFVRIALDAIHEERTGVAGMPEKLSFIAFANRLTVNEDAIHFDTATLCYSGGLPGLVISSEPVDGAWIRAANPVSLAAQFAASKSAYIVASVRHVMGHVWMEVMGDAFMAAMAEFEGVYEHEKIRAIHFGKPLPSPYAHRTLQDFFAESYVAWRSDLNDLLPQGMSHFLSGMSKNVSTPQQEEQYADPDNDPPSMMCVDRLSDAAGTAIWYFDDGVGFECEVIKNS